MAEKAVNSLKGETLVTLAGKEYKARITVNSIMQIEAACGMGIIKLTQKMSEGDIRRYFQICVGMIGISPESFWDMSPKEIFLALEGFSEFNGSGEEKPKPMTSGRMNELMELYPD